MVFGCHDNELSGYVYNNNQLPQWPCFRPIPSSAIGCTVVQTLACSGMVLVAMSLYTQPHPAQSMNAVQDQIFCHASQICSSHSHEGAITQFVDLIAWNQMPFREGSKMRMHLEKKKELNAELAQSGPPHHRYQHPPSLPICRV